MVKLSRPSFFDPDVGFVETVLYITSSLRYRTFVTCEEECIIDTGCSNVDVCQTLC